MSTTSNKLKRRDYNQNMSVLPYLKLEGETEDISAEVVATPGDTHSTWSQPLTLANSGPMMIAMSTTAVNNITNVNVVSSNQSGCEHSSQIEKYMCYPLACIIIMTIQLFLFGLYCLCCLDGATYMRCVLCGMITREKSYKHIYLAFGVLNFVYVGAIISAVVIVSATTSN